MRFGLVISKLARHIVLPTASTAVEGKKYGLTLSLKGHLKGEPAKLALAARLRRETTLTVRQIAERLHMGSWKSLNNKLYLRRKTEPEEVKK